MANYSYPNRVGRFGRTPAPITTFVKVDDRRSEQGPAVGRAEISEEHVAMPVSVTDGVVTQIETIERVYTTSATANTDGFTTNGEVIENYATTEGVQGSNRGAYFPRGLFRRQTLNNSKANSGTNEAVNAGATGSSKPIGGGNKDVGPNQLSKPGGGITKDVAPNRLSTRSGAGGADTGTNSRSRPIDGVTEDIGPNGRIGLTGGTTNGVPTNESRPTDVINSTGTSNLNRPSAGTNNSGSGAWKPIGGTNDTGNDGRNQSSGGGPGAAAGPDTSTNNWSRLIDGSTDNIGPSGRKGLTGGTTNGIPTNESRPTDVKNSTGTSTQNWPSAGANNSGYGTWIKPTAGTNNTGNDGRSWPSGGGGGDGGGVGTDASTNRWNGPIDGTANDIGPNGMKGLIGGTAYGIPNNESRPSIGTIPSRGSSVEANNMSARPVVGANNSSTGTWGNPIVGTNYGGNERSGLIGGTAYGIPNNESRPSIGTIPSRGSSVEANNMSARPVVGANNSSTGTWGNPIVETNYGGNERSGLTGGTNYIGADWTSRPRVMIADEYRPNSPAWGPPTNDIPTRRPTNYPSVALGWRDKFSSTTEPRTIDSNEAAEKYNGIRFTAPRPQRKKVIDSHEAAEKYRGLIL